MAGLADVRSINALIVGANRGIGLGFVQKLLQDERVDYPAGGTASHRIFAAHREPATPELSQLAQQFPGRLTLVAMDITDEEQIAAAVQQIRSQVNQLHFVIYCVGLLHDDEIQPEKGLQQIKAEPMLRYFQVNSIGAILLAKHLLPLLKHSETSIFASISAKVGSIGDNQLGGWYGYRASKAALNMLMKTAAIEYSRKSPKTIVVMLHPGTTDTQLSKPFQRNVPPEKLFSVDRTVSQLLSVISTLQPEHSGQFFSWDGSPLPW
ncbi:SDR family NAD(P)-dependent oxidoreductase [Leptolyngbya sp. FACHB-711]|uniref:SDR family NAD(P)-dependent oxidoreductase n=1 Tax=unclassified Leptolyngbya TaxID=2650499 RepID=UPI001687617D|nr:SDR family NAD(P)-dependent oxidoreductase [Leptolyngbya sp. FACHB-711]MBD1850057.1 SDR family NAD(P)-dependent oxidoreductase [Cyanobacteria bacterium FACHB-502]MBD2024777.1 SDR family NAD(P)-dependent oxidoreductase [Leptolyngbya sp. FACHB-711]